MVTTRSSSAKTPSDSLRSGRIGVGVAVRKSVSTRSLNAFQYSSLSDESSDIRLLNLLPGIDDEPIHIQIYHASLPRSMDNAPTTPKQTLEQIGETLSDGWKAYETWEDRFIFVNEELDSSSWAHPDLLESKEKQADSRDAPATPYFEALSYTWGSPHGRKAIFVEGPKNERTKLFVTKNLALALRHLRHREEPRALWIDAICINQQDIGERNTQVRRMPQIYRLAHRVVVWLGLGSGQSTLAMSTLRYLGEQVVATRQNHLVREPKAVESDWYQNSCDLPYDDETWRSILRLFQRTWFTRVWIVQEINLANTRAVLQSGKDSIPWATFRKAVLCLLTKNNLPSRIFRDEVASVAGLALFDEGWNYPELAMTIFDRDCSDPRDRVYGLLGLMSENLRNRISVDYSLPVEEVYKHTALAQVEHFARLDALRGCIWDDDLRAINAPSWVPDLILPPPSLESLRRQFSAGMSRSITRYDAAAPDILEVSGVQVGVVSVVQEGMSQQLGDGLEFAKVWQPHNIDGSYPGGGSLLDAYTMTLCGMNVVERFPWLLKLPAKEEWRNYCYDTVLGLGNNSEYSHEMGRVSPLFLSSVERLLLKRRFFSTEGGYIGLGPPGMQPGDVVVIMLGYDAPMVLRKAADQTYQVIGEGLVYGFNDAACLLGPLPEPWKLQIFLDSTGTPSLYRFYNPKTHQTTDDDPRLDLLQGWERLAIDRTADDAEVFQKFRNLSTGETVNYDPRMSPEVLKTKGVALQVFHLS